MWRGSSKVPGGVLYFVVDQATDTLVAASFRNEFDPSLPVRQRSFMHTACREYSSGNLAAFDAIRVDQHVTDFTDAVYRSMREIPPGNVATYGELAQRAGYPRAARAVGTACSSNAIPLVVPCHRVVAANGLGGYGYGRDVKIALLEHEGYVGD
ncbi:MAG: MGMT family protein [Candidatus Nanopelagicales bacterium]|nr:MGMT family protein [Candidatus Nanopelagicales bacterium]MCF8539385.1 MGMT family protein [Candidatus Nanopelagicales bacterium]